jgi:GT2 family glycosyltransferase
LEFILNSKVTINIAIACFNRSAKTLSCLESLYSQVGKFKLNVFLFDDSSTDDTVKLVKSRYPDTHIINGSGNAFWGGGMRKAMEIALGKPHDFILMLNDDCQLDSHAIENALNAYGLSQAYWGNPDSIIAGALLDSRRKHITYSGFIRVGKIDPAKQIQIVNLAHSLTPCDTTNGNFVLVPRDLAKKLGPIDANFPHQLGDLDYGYRAKYLGARLFIMQTPVGICDRNPPRDASQIKGIMGRYKALNHPLNTPIWPWVIFNWRHSGVIAAILITLKLTARIVLTHRLYLLLLTRNR